MANANFLDGYPALALTSILRIYKHGTAAAPTNINEVVERGNQLRERAHRGQEVIHPPGNYPLPPLNQAMSTASNPWTDGQTERANTSLEDCCFITSALGRTTSFSRFHVQAL
jgi:hypothetical protein